MENHTLYIVLLLIWIVAMIVNPRVDLDRPNNQVILWYTFKGERCSKIFKFWVKGRE